MSRRPSSDPRNHVINFRLTAREYQELRMAAETRGVLCLSDFARSALLAHQHLDVASKDGPSISAPPADPAIPRRGRIVTFRVSEEEFEALKSIHLETGFASFSELARSAIWRFVAERTQEVLSEDFQNRLADLDLRLSDLATQVERLNQQGTRRSRRTPMSA